MGSLLYGGPAKNCIISPHLETSFQPFSIQKKLSSDIAPQSLKGTEKERRILGLTFVHRFQGFVSYILIG
ncbi:MAG: hypothetical protein NT106_03715 [Candidatus Sumerlaeota bacterium]|nr:hypothetical protein [Candidatus Sumerlaeota bacterium]